MEPPDGIEPSTYALRVSNGVLAMGLPAVADLLLTSVVVRRCTSAWLLGWLLPGGMMVWQKRTREGMSVRILVTGGAGHLGRFIVSLLKDQGHHVRVLARTPGQDPAVEWIQGDLATGRGVNEAVSGTEVIVHAATF